MYQSSRYVVLLILLLTTFIPINVHVFNTLLIYDNQRLFQAAGLITVALVICLDRVFYYNFLPSLCYRIKSKAWLIYSLSILVFLTVLKSQQMEFALLELTNYLLLLLVVVYCCFLYCKNKNLFMSLLIKAVMIGLAFYYFEFFISYLAGLSEGLSIQREVLIHHFSNIRFFNQLQVMCVPILLYASISEASSTKSIRNLSRALLVISFLVLILCRARGAILSILLSFSLLILIAPQIGKAIALRVLGYLGLGIVLSYLLFEFIPWVTLGSEMSSLVVSTTSSGRYELWADTIEIIFNNWLFGVGPQHFSVFTSLIMAAHPHNTILQIAVEFGIPALILFSLAVLYLIKRWLISFIKLRESGTIESILEPYLTGCAFFSALTLSMFSGVHVMPISQLFFCILTGCFLGFSSQRSLVTRLDFNSIIFINLFRFFVLIFALLFSLLVWLGLERRLDDNIPYKDSPPKVSAPRFWQEGGLPDH